MARKRIAFNNAYMFDRVMLDERICSMFLERVLGVHVESIDYKNAEQVMEPALESKGVRLDLFVRSQEGAFDIEMQADLHSLLGRRFRYYQSVIDTQLLDKGASYYDLPESYIIFVCGFDPFGYGLPVYTLERACAEAGALDCGCGSHWVALNCKAYEDASEELRGLLKYVEIGAVDPEDELVAAIDEAVEHANDDRKWVDKVFSVSTIEEDVRREARYRERRLKEELHETQGQLDEARDQLGEARNQLGEARDQLGEARNQLHEAQEQARFGALSEKLIAAKRIDDLERASKDDAYRARLLEELGL